MSARSGPPRGRRLATRHWPNALLVLLVLLAAAGPYATGGGEALAAGVLFAAGAALVAAAPLLRVEDRSAATAADKVRWLGLGILAIHLALAGAEPPTWWLAYALVLVVATHHLRGWVRPLFLAGLVALVEAVPRAIRGGESAAPSGLLATFLGAGVAVSGAAWSTLPGIGLLAALAAVAARLSTLARREQDRLRDLLEQHEERGDEVQRLIQAGEYRKPEEAGLTPDGRTKRIQDAVADLDANLQRVLGLTGLAVGARSVFLFLDAGDAERLTLRSVAAAEGTKADRRVEIRLGEGLIGHAALTKRPALFTNLATDSLLPPLYRDATQVPSLLVVPVKVAGVACGVLVADAGEPGAFGRGHEEMLERFADEVGALLENARTDAHQERHSVRFETLFYFSRRFSSTIKLEELLEKMVKDIQRIVPYQRCALFLVDPAGRRLVLRAQARFLQALPEEREVSLGLDGDHFAAYLVSARPQIFTNLRERGRGVEIVPGAPGQERINSILSAPLRRGGGEPVGLLVLTEDEPGKFTAEDLELLTMVAVQAAVLISNALLHQQVELTAVTDGLTGLYNHRHFQERLQQELERRERSQERVSLLLLDIDHFKKINDTYGHPFGDIVIKALSAKLASLARRVDVVARYGGEEFVMILVNTDRKGCRTTAQRVLSEVREIKIPREGEDFSFTVSLGAATCPDDAANREDLVRCADQALYASKEGGRNQATAFEKVGKK
jgi:diguanylate cyclase (GGDEF)-like protein